MKEGGGGGRRRRKRDKRERVDIFKNSENKNIKSERGGG